MPTTHELNLHPEPFEKIIRGRKTIEMRLWDERRQRIQVGDKLIFLKRPDFQEKASCRVVALHPFPDFSAMCSALSLEALGYEGESLVAWLERGDHGMSVYYSDEQQAQSGVVGIEFVLEES